MATVRKIVFRNDYIYHVFNRGIERRSVFRSTREFGRAFELLKFYNHKEIPIRYSQFLQKSLEIREGLLKKLEQSEQLVEILAYCLMPNHFHLMLKQNLTSGIPVFISNFTNAYTKYFNKKYQRRGPLFEGIFKAVLVESDEQLVHLSRYIHLNPVVSSIIKETELNNYVWSSYREYLSDKKSNGGIANKELVLSLFNSVKAYENFVMDQIDYAKKLEQIKHLKLE